MRRRLYSCVKELIAVSFVVVEFIGDGHLRVEAGAENQREHVDVLRAKVLTVRGHFFEHRQVVEQTKFDVANLVGGFQRFFLHVMVRVVAAAAVHGVRDRRIFEFKELPLL